MTKAAGKLLRGSIRVGVEAFEPWVQSESGILRVAVEMTQLGLLPQDRELAAWELERRFGGMAWVAAHDASTHYQD